MPEHHHQLYLTDILDSGRAIQSYEAIAKLVIPAKAGIQCFCNILKFLDSGFRRNECARKGVTSARWKFVSE